MAAAFPGTHVWVGKASAVAAGEVQRLDLDCPEYRRIDQLCDSPFVVADALRRYLADRANSNGRVIAPLNGDFRLLSREPLRDKAFEDLSWAALSPVKMASSSCI